MVPLFLPGGLGSPELIIVFLVALMLIGLPLLLVVLVLVPFVRGYVGEDGDADEDELDALRERVAELEAEVERLREDEPR